MPCLGSETSVFLALKSIILQEKLANQMRSLWEKIPMLKETSKYGEGTDTWVVNRRMHFSLKKIEADMLKLVP